MVPMTRILKYQMRKGFDKSDGLTCGSPVKMETSPSVEPQAKTKPNSAGAN